MELLHRLSHEEAPQVEHHYEDSSTQTVKEERKKWHLFEHNRERGDGHAPDPAKLHPTAEQVIPPPEHVFNTPTQPTVAVDAEKDNKKNFLDIFHKHDKERSDASKLEEQVDPSTQTDKEEKKNFFEEILKHDDEVPPPTQPAVPAEPVNVPVETPAVAEHEERNSIFKEIFKHDDDVPPPTKPTVPAEHLNAPVEIPAVAEHEEKKNFFKGILKHDDFPRPTEPAVPAEHSNAPVENPTAAEHEEKKKFFKGILKHDDVPSPTESAVPAEPVNVPVETLAVAEHEGKKNFFKDILKHNDDEDVVYKVQSPIEPAVPAEPGNVPVETPAVTEHEEKKGFFHKHRKSKDEPDISKVLPAAESTAEPVIPEAPIDSATEHPAAAPAKRENLLERLHKKHHPDSRDKEDPDDAPKIDAPSQHAAAVEPENKDVNTFANIAIHQSHHAPEIENKKLKQEEAQEKASFFDHLTGKTERDEEERRRREEDEKRLEEEAEYKRKHPVSNFFDQISGKAAEEERQRKEEEEKRLKEEEERRKHPLTYGLGKLIEGNSPENEQPPHKPNFFEKISGKAAEDERKRKEEYYKKHPFAKLKDQFDEGLGGGKAGEANEDLLDKAIDEFQEHILHQGPQDDENAFEQIKDEQLARIIRAKYKARTGHEFPIRDRRRAS